MFQVMAFAKLLTCVLVMHCKGWEARWEVDRGLQQAAGSQRTGAQGALELLGKRAGAAIAKRQLCAAIALTVRHPRIAAARHAGNTWQLRCPPLTRLPDMMPALM